MGTNTVNIQTSLVTHGYKQIDLHIHFNIFHLCTYDCCFKRNANMPVHLNGLLQSKFEEQSWFKGNMTMNLLCRCQQHQLSNPKDSWATKTYPKQFDHLNYMKGTSGDYQLDNDNEFNIKLLSLTKMIYLFLVTQERQ